MWFRFWCWTKNWEGRNPGSYAAEQAEAQPGQTCQVSSLLTRVWSATMYSSRYLGLLRTSRLTCEGQMVRGRLLH